jgi:hypothetical protein
MAAIAVACAWFSPQQSAAQQNVPSPVQGLAISQVSASARSFAPFLKESLQIRYLLSRDAAVTVRVFDPDQELVRAIATKAPRKAGANRETWDGRDVEGKVVPNEAYFLTIEAEAPGLAPAVYDPITFSGGDFGDITRGELSRDMGTFSYKLGQPSRVRIRTGVQGSAMAKALVDWEPRVAGTITERWNGMDEDNLISVWNRERFIMLLTYFTLPENSVITVGNGQYTYRAYKLALPAPRARKEERPFTGNRKISPHFLHSREAERAFHVRLTFPELEKDRRVELPEVKDTILVRVDVDPVDRPLLLNQQYEIMLFNDFIFHAEEERGYLPFNFPWEVKQLPAGEHVLTLNISTHSDQVGVGSRKIRVIK